MNILLIKQISLLSVILGAILGVLTLIPYLGIFTFLICIFATGSLVILYMQKLELLGELDIKTWSIYGAISGFIGFVGFSLTFVPLATLIGLMVKTSYYLGVSLMFRLGFFITILMIIFVAILSALMNGFGSMATSYFIEAYKQIKNNEEKN